MEDMKEITKGIKEELVKYGFKQKGTSRTFFYDCGWYLILAELVQCNKSIAVITGINYCWDDKYSFSIREETRTDLNFDMTEFTPVVKKQMGEWVNTKKEYFLKTYKFPLDMLSYLKKHNDIHHQPHGYVIARLFKDETEKSFFEKEAIDLLEIYNAGPGVYILPSNGEKGFRKLESYINNLIQFNDKDFMEEINRLINEKRKKLKLKVGEVYFNS